MKSLRPVQDRYSGAHVAVKRIEGLSLFCFVFWDRVHNPVDMKPLEFSSLYLLSAGFKD